MEWIKVSDRLPKDHSNVLCFVVRKRLANDDISNECHVGKFKDGKPFVVGNYFAWDIGDVTHWMPLPEPPKED